MSDGGQDGRRVQQLLAALVQRRIEESLGRVEHVLAQWRRGERNVLAAHAEVLRHHARSTTLSARVARAGLEGPAPLLREALDLSLLDEAEFRELVGKAPDEVAPPPPLDEEAGPRSDLPAKRTVMSKLLEDGPVLVHLDPRREGVDVPPGHRADARLVLRFGYGLTPPIPDLAVDDEGLVGTLTFRGVPYRCAIPWHAVFALVDEDGRGLVWGEDVPGEVAQEYIHPRGGAGTSSTPRPGDGGDRPPEKPEPPKPRRGHLKLV